MINSEEKYRLIEHDAPASFSQELCPLSRCPELDLPASNPKGFSLGKMSLEQVSAMPGDVFSSPEHSSSARLLSSAQPVPALTDPRGLCEIPRLPESLANHTTSKLFLCFPNKLLYVQNCKPFSQSHNK